jgi:Flp pilus assembly protein TadG
MQLNKRERGSSLVEAGLVATFVLIPLLLGSIDFGRAFFVSIEVANAARAGAQYGAQSQAAMQDSANIVLAAQKEAPDVAAACGAGKNACWVGGYPQSAWGCECSNQTLATGGTPNSTACTCTGGHVVDYVLVTTKATYTPMFNMFGWFKPITLNSQAKLRWALQ